MITKIIPAINLEFLREKINKLNRRADKFGLKPIELEILNTIKKKHRDENLDFEYEVSYVECSISDHNIKFNGWHLIAVIQPVNGENVIREVPGQKCPNQYRATGLQCEHCNTVRRRSELFIVRHEDGSYKQVGRNCLADFLGHVSPETLLAQAESLFDLGQSLGEAEDYNWGGGGKTVVDTEHFVSVVSIVCKKLGWLPRSKANEMTGAPTASIAWDICTRRDESIRSFIKDKGLIAEQSDNDLAVTAIKWASEIDPLNAPSTYLHDLGVCCRQPYIDHKACGYVASVVAAYKRHLSEQVVVKKAAGKFLGEIDQRATFSGFTITHATPYQSGNYPKTFVRFVDDDGNALVWRASGSPEWVEIGTRVSIKATIIKHETFRDQPNTIISRVKKV